MYISLVSPPLAGAVNYAQNYEDIKLTSSFFPFFSFLSLSPDSYLSLSFASLSAF